MKYCIFKSQNRADYDTWLDAFESGVWYTDSFEELDPFEYFKIATITSNGEILTTNDKYILLECIKSDLVEKTPSVDAQTLQKLDTLIQSFGTKQANQFPLQVITKSDFQTNRASIVNIKNPLQIQSDLAAFIPIVSTKINSHILSRLTSEFKQFCLWDDINKTLVDDDIELTATIEGYKLSLIKTLQTYTGIKNSIEISDLLTKSSVDNYNLLMQTAWNKISSYVTNHGIIDVELTPSTITNIIDPIMAFYVLQNFDKCIDRILSDFIFVDPRYKHQLISESRKYKLKNRERQNSSWNDDINSSSGENIFDHALNIFITSIIDPVTKQPLKKNFIENFMVVIKDALENQNYSRNNQTPQLNALYDAVFNTTLSIEERISKLISYLNNPHDNVRLGSHSPLRDIAKKLDIRTLKAIGKKLDEYNTAYQNKYKNSSPAKKAKMDKFRNVGEKILTQFEKGVNGIVQVSDNGISYLQSGHKFQTKHYVTNRLKSALTNLLTNDDAWYFEKGVMVGNTSADTIIHLNSEEAIQFLTLITGIEFRNEEIRNKFERDPLTVTYFIREYRRIVREVNKNVNINVKEKVDLIIRQLKGNTNYITFSDIIIKDNTFNLERMFDQNLQEQARTTIPTVSTSQTHAISKFKKQFGTYNMLVSNQDLSSQTEKTWQMGKNLSQDLRNTGDFIQAISFAGDVKLGKQKKSVKWVELNETQIVEAWIKHLYVQSAVENGVITFQPDAASDKVKVPFISLNLVGKNILDMSSADIQSDIYFRQHSEYYKQVEQKILQSWSKIIPNKTFRSLEELNAFLKQNPVSLNPDTDELATNIINLAERIRRVQQDDPYFTFQNQIDYAVDKNGFVTMNNSLMEEVKRAHDQKYFETKINSAFETFLQNFNSYGVLNLIPESWSEQSLNLLEKETLGQLLDISVEDVDVNIKNIILALKGQNLDSAEILDLRNRFLKKWFLLFNSSREAFLQLFQKQYWLHDKNRDGDLAEEMSGRITKGKKRNNAESATMCRLQQGLKYGVGRRIRTATIESMTTDVTNHFGITGQLNSHDGAIYTSYILRILERNSSTSVEMSDVSKIIALSQSKAGFEQIKCADYAMSNVWIQNTIKQPANNKRRVAYTDPTTGQSIYKEEDIFTQYFDGKILMEKMLRPAKLSKNPGKFIDNLKNNKVDRMGLKSPIVQIGGKRAILDYFGVGQDNNIECQYRYIDSGEFVDNSDLASALGLSANYLIETDSFIINDLFDLWSLFGAEFSEEQNENGTYKTSNISQEWIAYLISEYDPELKELMIGKIIDIQASKSTQQFENKRTDVWDPEKELITGTLDTLDYGVQQDSSHLTDEDDISSLTQVIAAIAINGQNSELAEELYELLGQVTEEQITALLELPNMSNKSKFHLELGKSIAKSLSRNTVVSNAARILADNLHQIINNNQTFAAKALPISNQQLYWFVTSDLLSRLNRVVRQRFSGQAVVQNPAQGIIGMYETASGEMITKSDVKDLALEDYKEKPWRHIDSSIPTTSQIINKYVADNFHDEKLTLETAGKLTIGYTVQYPIVKTSIDPSTNKPITQVIATKTEEILDPIKLKELYNLIQNGYEVTIIRTLPRNLATSNTLWTEQIAETVIDETTGELTTIIKTVGNNLWLMQSMDAMLSGNPSLLEKKWHSDNLKMLETQQAYYKTLDDYKNGTLTPVYNLQKKSGEEVLPKQYEKKLGLTKSLFHIKKQGPSYFEELIKNRYKLQDGVDVGSFNARNEQTAFAVSTNNFDVIYFDDPNQNIDDNTVLEQIGQNKYQLYTLDGKKIEGAIFPTNDCEIEYQESESGKDLIKVKFEKKQYQQSGQIIVQSVLSHPQKVRHLYSLLDWNGVHIGNYSNTNIWKNDDDLRFDLNSTKEELDPSFIKAEAKKVYNSFLLTLKTISARIPSQSFQSFLSNETVAFTEDQQNNGYMNIWEMWFQGSDYDIDKAYTLIFGLDGSGKIPSHNLTDYSSADTIFKSLLLPNPNKDLYIKTSNRATKKVIENESKFQEMLFSQLLEMSNIKESEFNQSISIIENLGIDRIAHLLKLLKENAEHGYLIVADSNSEFEKTIAQALNIYNTTPFSELQSKNKVMAVIRHASSDLRNLRASEVPMEAKYVNDCIKTSNAKVDTQISIRTQYVNEDPTHIANFQYQAAIGKTGVGVSANSIKAVSSIQQRANIQHNAQNIQLQRWLTATKEGRYVEDINIVPELNLDLKIPIKYKNEDFHNVEAQIRHIPNSVLSKDLFRAYYDPHPGSSLSTTDITKHPLYSLYTKLSNSQNSIPKNHKEEKFIECFNMLLTLHQTTNTPFDFIDVLYEMYLEEENVADMLSIFISLCTDNAKELSLYKIGAIPELLNIPLTLISLGVDMQDVTDICVQYLVPLVKELSNSLTETKGFDEVRTKIGQLATSDKISPELQQGYQELYNKILPTAQRLRIISRYFKINQGASTHYDEVIDFISELDQTLVECNIVNQEGLIVKFSDFFNISKDLNKEAEVQQLIKDSIQLYANNDRIHSYNILDVILNSKHFYHQLKGLVATTGAIKNTIGIAYLTNQIKQKITTDKTFSSRNISQVAHNVLFCNSLKRLTDIAFDKEATMQYFGQWDPSIGNSALVGISTYNQVEHFIKFIEAGVVPYLKNHFSENFFVSGFNLNTRVGHFTLPFNSYDKRGDLRTDADMNQASTAFESIAGIQSGLKTVNGTPVTIGDLLYMYTMLVNGGRTNTTLTIMYPGMNKYSQIKFDERTNEYYGEVDRLTGIATYEGSLENLTDIQEQSIAQQELDNLLDQVLSYVQAAKNDKGEFVSQSGVKYKVDTQIPFYALNPGFISTDTEYSTEEEDLIDLIQTILTDNRMGASLVIQPNSPSVLWNNSVLSFQIRIPKRIGDDSEVFKTIHITQVDNREINGRQQLTQYGLHQIQKAITSNIGSIKAQLLHTLSNQSGRYFENYNLSEDKQIKALLKALPESYKEDIFVQKLLSKINTLADTLVIDAGDYVKSHIENIDGNKVVVINKYDFNEKISLNTRLYTLINLLLDNELKGIPSERKRLGQLIRNWFEIKGPSGTLEQIIRLSEVKKLLGESQLLYKYYQGLLSDTVTLETKTTARNNLILSQRALLYEKYFYYDYVGTDAPREGDIFEEITPDGTSNRYVFLGKTLENVCIFAPIQKGISDIKFIYQMSTDTSFKRVKRQKIHFNHCLNNEAFKDSSFLPAVEYKDHYPIKIGEALILQSGQRVIVSDVLYRKTTKGFDRELLYFDENNTLQLVDPKKIKKVEFRDETFVMSDSMTIPIKIYNNDIQQIPTKFIKHMLELVKSGVEFKVQDRLYVLKSIDGDILSTMSGQVFNISDIVELYIPISTMRYIDPFIFQNIIGTYMLFDPLESIGAISTLPMFKDGLVIQRSNSKEAQKYIKPTITLNDTKYHKFILDHDAVRVKMDVSNIEVGDYIVCKEPYECYKVLDMQTVETQGNINTYFTVVKQKGQSISTEIIDEKTGTFTKQVADSVSIIPMHENMFNNKMELWKTNRNISHARISNRTNSIAFNRTDKVYNFLDALAEIFGTQVQIINDPNLHWMASVDNGTVLINIGKADGESPIDFILNQSVHEFAHLFITAFRMKYPEKYVQMLQKFKTLREEDINMQNALKKLDSELYSNSTSQLDELLVNALTESIKTNNYGNLKSENILNIFNTAIYSLFADSMKTISSFKNWERSIFGFLTDVQFNNSKELTLSTLREQTLSDEFVEKIQYKECK